jgi:ParB family chromosome partitioning protein
LSIGHAKLLLALPAPRQLAWARDVLQRGWSVRALERQLATLDRPGSVAKPANTSEDHELRRLENTIAEQLGYPVRIEASGEGRGELRIRFHSPAELDGVLERIGVKPETAS